MADGAFPEEERLRELVGERLTLALEALQIRPSACAEMLGIAPPRLTHWTHGRHFPDPYRLALFCHLTGVTLDYLYLGRLGSLPADMAAPLRARLAAPRPAAEKP